MKIILKMMVWLISIIIVFYILILTLLYNFQEKLIFVPEKLPISYQYKFDIQTEERFIETNDKVKLNALLFRANKPKGVIFFLHGNAGSLNSWGNVSGIYTENNYDVFLYDYRGYGKSEGEVTSELQFYDDARLVYNSIKKEYIEGKIIIVGQSLGSAAAAMLAAENKPKKLILLTAYFSLNNLIQKKYRIIPAFLLKYPFKTYEFVKETKAPITLIHGTKDNLINYENSVRLRKLCKKNDELYIIENMKHNGVHDNVRFQKKLREALK